MKMTLILALMLSSVALASHKNMNVIYGEDNRLDVFESKNSDYVELSKSTAAMISLENLRRVNSSEIQISSQTLESRGVCKKERFSQQMSGANCSGFLVAENILVTAGHCIKSQVDCDGFKWVFDYKVDYADQGIVNVASSNVYTCKRIIERKLDQISKNDYAVIELDRKTDRRPLSFRRKGKISMGTPLVVIGHPSGLPTKIADGAKVRSLSTLFFVANLDTYGGNSGSAVFNTKTSEVEGILVRGENDYVYDDEEGCQVSYRCPNDSCRGEDVTYITGIDFLKKLP